jgi:DNA-binding NarL/FixJ family response regulator
LTKRIAILSVHSSPEEIFYAMQAGADIFIQKGSSYTIRMETFHPKQQKGE